MTVQSILKITDEVDDGVLTGCGKDDADNGNIAMLDVPDIACPGKSSLMDQEDVICKQRVQRLKQLAPGDLQSNIDTPRGLTGSEMCNLQGVWLQ
ncbi:hypothetical protein RRG08_061001 [Elysia crispata]|uniref:Uncharacterized protein n=1 Tax=Elysia crispata TaxID=231223 RepID=A0AAE1AVW5_9GAST|nr:hypothetical protein RRG08_061001 [Elysia crispata]